MAFVSAHFTLDVIRFAGALLEADGTGRWRARWQVTRFLFGEPGIFRKIGARGPIRNSVCEAGFTLAHQ